MIEHIDLSAFELPVLMPSDDELAAHRAVLADIDKASRGKLLWQARSGIISRFPEGARASGRLAQR